MARARTPLHEVFGLACGLSSVPVMERAHRHDDVELLLPLGGSAVVEHAGGRHDVPADVCAVLWAGLPHRVSENDEGTSVAWLTVPLAEVLGWPLPASFTADLLRGGAVLMDAPPRLALAMADWQRESRAGSASARAVRLEAQAWLTRAASASRASTPDRPDDAATAMLALISQRFREPLRVADVAAAVHLHPSTASAVFREATGVTIGEYLAQCRVAEAQRLLIQTDATTAEVAQRAGFGSTSRLYERFARDCGTSPAAYRRTMR
ncbi:MAG: helix-turn-helix domain-containing protein [Candidatus Nanopelagicales bacterium]|jgi:AraC-like DNA-binding protein